MQSSPDLFQCLEAQIPAALELLRQMVSINSHTLNRNGVRELSQVTIEAFAELGFTPEFVPSSNPHYADHLVLTRPGICERRVGLISHLDTVFTMEEESRNRFSWREDGNRIYGPGTEDVKGGTVMMWLVLQALRATQREIFERTTWLVLLDASEEMLSADFGQMASERLRGAEAALVFEAGLRQETLYQVVTARKGRALFRITVEGRGAHAGNSHARGANAIAQLAHTIQRVEALTDHSRGITFNVGTVSGGETVNRVPHLAEARGEMRAFDAETYQQGLAKLMELEREISVQSVADKFPCRVRITIENETPPWPKNEGTEKLLEVYRQAGQELGFVVSREERAGLSDGNYLWDAVPTLDGLGPMGDNAHCSEHSEDGTKEQEYVDRSSFVPKAALNVKALTRLLSH